MFLPPKLRKTRSTADAAPLLQWANEQPWTEWWVEFQTAAVSGCGLKYASAREFFRQKILEGTAMGRDEHLRFSLALKMTGERPGSNGNTTPAKAKLQVGELYDFRLQCKGGKPILVRASWLGDWERQREVAFRLQGAQGKFLRRMLNERVDALEAGRQASRIPLSWVERFATVGEQIDQYFGATLVRANEPWAINYKRIQEYLRLQAQVMDSAMTALQKYLECHGIRADVIGA